MMARLRGAALAVLVARVEAFAPRPAALHPITRTIATMDHRSSNASFSEATSNIVHPPMRASRRTSLSMSAPSAAGAGATILSSLHSNNSFILSALLVVSACGIALEKNSTLGKALSAPLVTMLISLILANVGFIPFSSPVYSFTNQALIPLAVPLFLFDSDLKRVVRDAGSLLAAFFVGAISTVVGTLGAMAVIPLKRLGEQGWKVAAALCSRHIGGAINFVAVADTLCIDGSVVSAAIAADNVVVALYFALLFSLATAGPPAANDNDDTDAIGSETLLSEEFALPNEEEPVPITTSSVAYAIATASCLVTLGSAITAAVCPGLSSLVFTSLLTVISATIFPGWFERLRTSGTAIGILFLQMFFAASGAAGSLLLVLRQAPSLIAFSALQLGIHFVVLVGLGRGVLKLNANELYLASNANVGGPTTAAAMAQAKEWPKRVLPALLVGVLGYATATALSLSLGPVLIRLAMR
ncbi:hypothetical protein ACHAXT_002991 [Thalassiosira profunda]